MADMKSRANRKSVLSLGAAQEKRLQSALSVALASSQGALHRRKKVRSWSSESFKAVVTLPLHIWNGSLDGSGRFVGWRQWRADRHGHAVAVDFIRVRSRARFHAVSLSRFIEKELRSIRRIRAANPKLDYILMEMPALHFRALLVSSEGWNWTYPLSAPLGGVSVGRRYKLATMKIRISGFLQAHLGSGNRRG